MLQNVKELSFNHYCGIQALINVILAPFLAIITKGRRLFYHIIEDEPVEFAPFGLKMDKTVKILHLDSEVARSIMFLITTK